MTTIEIPDDDKLREINHRWVENPIMCECLSSVKYKGGTAKCKYPATFLYKKKYYCARHMGPFLIQEKLDEQRVRRARCVSPNNLQKV